MNLDALYLELTLKTGAKLALVVLDGLGDLATRRQNNLTPLEAASTPNLDALAKDSAQGRMIPVAPGITPGSGPGHLGLFGYDPLEFQVGRGVIETLGLGVELKHGDVAARANFCTLDAKGVVTDRRAGRIPTETCEKLCAMLATKVKKIGDTEIIIKPGKEHRFVVVFRGKGLEGLLTDADPNREGFAIPTVKPRDPKNGRQKKMAKLIAEFYKKALPIIAKEKPANGFLMRGIAHQPHIPLFEDRYFLKAAALAVYPMYKGLAQLVGMKKLKGRRRSRNNLSVTSPNTATSISSSSTTNTPTSTAKTATSRRRKKPSRNSTRRCRFCCRKNRTCSPSPAITRHRARSKATRGIRSRCCCTRRIPARTSWNVSPKPAPTSARSACSRRNISSG